MAKFNNDVEDLKAVVQHVEDVYKYQVYLSKPAHLSSQAGRRTHASMNTVVGHSRGSSKLGLEYTLDSSLRQLD